MIAELFYPKELKDIITDLRAKDDLNEGALYRMNIDALFKKSMFIILAGISIFVSFYLEEEAVSVVLRVCSLPFLILAFLPITGLNRFIMPYASGTGTVGEIVGAQYEVIPFRGYKGWNIRYDFFDQKGYKHTGSQTGISREDMSNRKIEVGDEIEIYYLLSKPSANAPFLKSRYREFSLKKEPKNSEIQPQTL